MLSNGYWWLLPVLGVVFMVALLVFASRRRRRATDEASL
jgi:cytochrome c-type biogenesis protein CcmH/NrfF